MQLTASTVYESHAGSLNLYLQLLGHFVLLTSDLRSSEVDVYSNDAFLQAEECLLRSKLCRETMSQFFLWTSMVVPKLPVVREDKRHLLQLRIYITLQSKAYVLTC